MGKYQRLISRITGSVDYWAQAAMRQFVLDIDRRMQIEKISRAQLAEKLGTTPAYVTKVMRGDVNFTLETMTKLALAVGGKLQVRIADANARSEVNRVVIHDESPKCQLSIWRSEKAKQRTSADTKRLQLNLAAVANQTRLDYEKQWDHAA